MTSATFIYHEDTGLSVDSVTTEYSGTTTHSSLVMQCKLSRTRAHCLPRETAPPRWPWLQLFFKVQLHVDIAPAQLLAHLQVKMATTRAASADLNTISHMLIATHHRHRK